MEKIVVLSCHHTLDCIIRILIIRIPCLHFKGIFSQIRGVLLLRVSAGANVIELPKINVFLVSTLFKAKKTLLYRALLKFQTGCN